MTDLQGHSQPVVLASGVNVIPGAGVLGFGVGVSVARDVSDLTQRIVLVDERHGTTVTEGGVEYLLPANVVLNDIHTSDISYNVFVSEHAFQEHMAAEAEIRASAWGFSGAFEAAYSSLRQEWGSSYYGLVEASTRLWSVTVPQLGSFSLDATFAAELEALPGTFDRSTQQAFFDLFVKYGTHVVSTAVVGGELRYVVSVSSNSSFNQTTASASMSYEYKSLFVDSSGSAKADWDRIDRSWFASRQAQLHVQGGQPSILAGFAPPADPNAPVSYHDVVGQWANTIASAPSQIGYQLQPLSAVAPVRQVHVIDTALEAYLNQTVGAYGTAEVAHPSAGRSFPLLSNTSSMLVGKDEVDPPTPPRQRAQPLYWIAMVDEAGSLRFNENVLADDPDAFDALIGSARKAASGHAWWTIVVVSGTVRPPSDVALAWLQACGLPDWLGRGYPGFPDQFVGIGKSNSPAFDGRVDCSLGPPARSIPGPPWRLQVTAAAPLYAARVS